MEAFSADLFLPRVYSVIRKYAPFLTMVGALGSVALVRDEFYRTLIVSLWGAIAISLMLFACWRSSEVSKRFGGNIREFVYAPHPMGSLIESLEKQGIPLSVVNEIKLMSANLNKSLEYFHEGDGEGEPFIYKLRRHPALQMVVYGPAIDPEIKSDDGQIRLVHTGDPEARPLTEHLNLIMTRNGPTYLWYEPYHNMVGKRNFFTGGAYLIEIDSAVRNDIEKRFERLATEHLGVAATN